MERSRPPHEPGTLDNKYTYSEYWPPEYFQGKDMKELILDTVLIGQAVLGIRALVEPDKYSIESPVIQQSILTAQAMGFVKNGVVEAPHDVMEIAYPTKTNNGFH